MFLDETAATTSMIRRYGWAERGARCRIAAPAGHQKTTTVIAGLRTSGPEAVAVLDRPMTGERFRAYVSEALVPTLWTCSVKAALRHFVWHPRAFSGRVRMTELGDGETTRGSRQPVTLHRERA